MYCTKVCVASVTRGIGEHRLQNVLIPPVQEVPVEAITSCISTSQHETLCTLFWYYQKKRTNRKGVGKVHTSPWGNLSTE